MLRGIPSTERKAEPLTRKIAGREGGMATPTAPVSLRDSLHVGVCAGFISSMHLLFAFTEFLSRTKQTGDSLLVMSQKANSHRERRALKKAAYQGQPSERKRLTRREEPD